MKRIQVLVGLFVVAAGSLVHAQVPRPTMNISGGYFYDHTTGDLIVTPVNMAMTTLFVTDVQYLDGTTSTSDPIVEAQFAVTGLTFIGIDSVTDEAIFTNGSIVVSKPGTTFFTADLVNVRLNDSGFGDFGNINIGFTNTNITNLAFVADSGSRFVDEFADLIAPAGVPDEGKVQFSLRMLFPLGPTPATFADNFSVSSLGSVLGVFDGAPLPSIDPCATNEPPAITILDVDPLVSLAGEEVCFVAYFDDPDSADALVATWDFGDGSPPEVLDLVASPLMVCHAYAFGGSYTATLTITDDCNNTNTRSTDLKVLNNAACFAINRLKIGMKQPRCKGVSLLEMTSTVDTDQLVAVYVPDEGKDKLGKETTVDDGVNGPVTIHTSCSQPLDVDDVYGPYTVTDVVKVFDEEHDFRGNKVEVRGSFDAAVGLDLSVDDVLLTLNDEYGHSIDVLVPAGSFQREGDDKKKKHKFKYKATTDDGVEVKAKFNHGRCDFDFKLKGVTNTNEFTGTTLTVRLQVGDTVGQEVLDVVDKHNHLEHKKKPKVKCCPKCHGISLLQLTSDQGVLEFVPEPGKEKLAKEIVASDEVNPAVTIHTSCSQPIDVGDVFGAYTVSEVVKVFED